MGIVTFSFKNATGRCRFFRLAFAGGMLLVASLLSSHLQSGNCASIEASPWGWGNGTTTSATAEEEYVTRISDDQEFLTDSAFGNILAPNGKRKSFGYGSLQKKPTCKADIYGKCITPNPGQIHRPCDYKGRCVRHIK